MAAGASTMAASSSSYLSSVAWLESSAGSTRRSTVRYRRCKSRRIHAQIKDVDSAEAKKLVAEEGYTVLDVRDKSQFDRSRIASATHIPLFIENNDNDISTIINRALHNGFSGLFYGVAFTKLNPGFLDAVQKKYSKASKLLLVCQEGLRSGRAAEALEAAGFENLAYIDGGLQKVQPGTFQKEGPRELQDAGKAGLVTIQGQFSTALGSVLIAAYLFLTFFPTQAEDLFFKK